MTISTSFDDPIPGERLFYGYGGVIDSDVLLNPLHVWFRTSVHRTGVDPHCRILGYLAPTPEPPELPPQVLYSPPPDRHIRRSGDDYGTAFLTLLPQGQAWPKAPGTTLDLVCRGLSMYWGDVDRRAADLLEQESDPRRTIELLPDWERNWGLPDPCYKAPQTVGERQQALVQRMTIEGGQSRDFFIGVARDIGYHITISEFRTFVVGLDRCGDNRMYGRGTSDAPISPSFTWFRVSVGQCGIDPHCRIAPGSWSQFGTGPARPMYNEWGNPILNPRGLPVEVGELSAWPNYGFGPATNRYYWTVHVDQAKLVWFRCSVSQCGVDPHLRIGLADDLECLLNRWKPAHTKIIFDYSGMMSLPRHVWFQTGIHRCGVDPHCRIFISGAITGLEAVSLIVPWAPIMTAPILTENFSLITGAPIFEVPVLRQCHVLTAANLVSFAPVLGTPTLNPLTGSDLVTPAPILGRPTLS